MKAVLWQARPGPNADVDAWRDCSPCVPPDTSAVLGINPLSRCSHGPGTKFSGKYVGGGAGTTKHFATEHKSRKGCSRPPKGSFNSGKGSSEMRSTGSSNTFQPRVAHSQNLQKVGFSNTTQHQWCGRSWHFGQNCRGPHIVPWDEA